MESRPQVRYLNGIAVEAITYESSGNGHPAEFRYSKPLGSLEILSSSDQNNHTNTPLSLRAMQELKRTSRSTISLLYILGLSRRDAEAHLRRKKIDARHVDLP